jgi:polyferredoxin
VKNEAGTYVSWIDPELCTGCGSCAGACPADAIEQEAYPDSLLTGMELDAESLTGRAVVFACSRSPLPDDTPDLIKVPCIGRVSIEHMMQCLARDAAGVMLMCRDQETCPHAKGGALGQARAEVADAQAYETGLGLGRIMYVQPKPGLEGPADAVAAFRATHTDSPLKEAYPGSRSGLHGMDHALEIKEWMKHQPELKPSRTVNKRTITQAISLVLLHSSLWDWAQLKWFCNPVLSCHSCALSWFACPVGVFVHYSGYHAFPFIAVGTVLLLGVLFARLLCGWVCPFGFLQDLLHKVPTRKFVLPAWTSYIKYAVLILGVFMLPFFLGEQTAFSFCRICPAAALQSTIPNLVNPAAEPVVEVEGAIVDPEESEQERIANVLIMVKLGALGFFLVLVTFSNRAFCRTVCPIGAMLAPLNMISFFKIKTPPKSCINCNWCDKVCPASGKPSSRVSKEVPANRVMDCIYCYECKDACPMHGPVEVDLKKQGKKLALMKKD